MSKENKLLEIDDPRKLVRIIERRRDLLDQLQDPELRKSGKYDRTRPDGVYKRTIKTIYDLNDRLTALDPTLGVTGHYRLEAFRKNSILQRIARKVEISRLPAASYIKAERIYRREILSKSDQKHIKAGNRQIERIMAKAEREKEIRREREVLGDAPKPRVTQEVRKPGRNQVAENRVKIGENIFTNQKADLIRMLKGGKPDQEIMDTLWPGDEVTQDKKETRLRTLKAQVRSILGIKGRGDVLERELHKVRVVELNGKQTEARGRMSPPQTERPKETQPKTETEAVSMDALKALELIFTDPVVQSRDILQALAGEKKKGEAPRVLTQEQARVVLMTTVRKIEAQIADGTITDPDDPAALVYLMMADYRETSGIKDTKALEQDIAEKLRITPGVIKKGEVIFEARGGQSETRNQRQNQQAKEELRALLTDVLDAPLFHGAVTVPQFTSRYGMSMNAILKAMDAGVITPQRGEKGALRLTPDQVATLLYYQKHKESIERKFKSRIQKLAALELEEIQKEKKKK